MPFQLLAERRNRVSSLIREDVQGKEPIHLDAVVLSKTDPVRLHLTHRLIGDLLSRLRLVLCLGFQVKQDELTVELDEGIQSTSERYCAFIAAHLMLRADDMIKVLPKR